MTSDHTSCAASRSTEASGFRAAPHGSVAAECRWRDGISERAARGGGPYLKLTLSRRIRCSRVSVPILFRNLREDDIQRVTPGSRGAARCIPDGSDLSYDIQRSPAASYGAPGKDGPGGRQRLALLAGGTAAGGKRPGRRPRRPTLAALGGRGDGRGRRLPAPNGLSRCTRRGLASTSRPTRQAPSNAVPRRPPVPWPGRITDPGSPRSPLGP